MPSLQGQRPRALLSAGTVFDRGKRRELDDLPEPNPNECANPSALQQGTAHDTGDGNEGRPSDSDCSDDPNPSTCCSQVSPHCVETPSVFLNTKNVGIPVTGGIGKPQPASCGRKASEPRCDELALRTECVLSPHTDLLTNQGELNPRSVLVQPKAAKATSAAKVTFDNSVGQLGSKDPRSIETVKRVQHMLKTLRVSHTVEEAKERYSSSLPSHTVFELASGGGLFSMAAAYAGFRHLGSTEDVSKPLGAAKARLIEDLTSARCYGDTRDWKQWCDQIPGEIDYLKSGQPCTDYASLGKRQGRHGKKGGDLFMLQVEIILHLKPKIINLEMVPTAIETNDGYEVQWVFDNLSTMYHINPELLDCWKYGDVSSRSRLILIGLRKDLFTSDSWEWPDPICDESFYPTARDIAVPDNRVPDNYWRYDRPITYKNTKDSKPGRLQHIGYAGDPSKPNEAGFSDNPYNIQGWDGMLATQMATNGGSRRPTLLWQPGEPIGDTRMTVPIESCRAASLAERSYMQFARKHYDKKLGLSYDQWLRELVNLGVPLSMGTAIDLRVKEVLEQSRIPVTDHCCDTHNCSAFNALKSVTDRGVSSEPETYAELYEHKADSLIDPMDFNHVLMSREVGVSDHEPHESVTMGVGDSGATDHLHDASYNCYLRNAVPSTTSYQIADGGSITGDLEGDMDVTVLNLDHQPKGPPMSDHTIHTTTVKGLGAPLWSLEAAFRDQGYDIRMSHGYHKSDWTGMYRPPQGHKHGPESFIPMVYNYQGSGGWRVPYVVRRPGHSEDEHLAKLTAILQQSMADSSKGAKHAAKVHECTCSMSKRLEQYYWACPAVSQSITVRVPGERDIRPSFTYGGLRRYKAKNWHEFHSAMAHMGEPGMPCSVCSMFKGEARPIPKHRFGKPRDRRPGHVWHMDMIVFRERSEEGSKYLIVLTDECTQAIQLIPLYWKSDATYELRRWIRSMRSHPAYVGLDYQVPPGGPFRTLRSVS